HTFPLPVGLRRRGLRPGRGRYRSNHDHQRTSQPYPLETTHDVSSPRSEGTVWCESTSRGEGVSNSPNNLGLCAVRGRDVYLWNSWHRPAVVEHGARRRPVTCAAVRVTARTTEATCLAQSEGRARAAPCRQLLTRRQPSSQAARGCWARRMPSA